MAFIAYFTIFFFFTTLIPFFFVFFFFFFFSTFKGANLVRPPVSALSRP